MPIIRIIASKNISKALTPNTRRSPYSGAPWSKSQVEGKPIRSAWRGTESHAPMAWRGTEPRKGGEWPGLVREAERYGQP